MDPALVSPLASDFYTDEAVLESRIPLPGPDSVTVLLDPGPS